jgi:hypothetical protein
VGHPQVDTRRSRPAARRIRSAAGRIRLAAGRIRLAAGRIRSAAGHTRPVAEAAERRNPLAAVADSHSAGVGRRIPAVVADSYSEAAARSHHPAAVPEDCSWSGHLSADLGSGSRVESRCWLDV